MKTSRTALGASVAILLLQTTSCRRSSEEVIAPVAPAPVEVDYRDQFCDDFLFTVRVTSWMLGQPVTEDTVLYDGSVRIYEVEDSAADLFNDDDSAEDVDRKVTIRFLEGLKITSLIEEDGTLVDRTGYHYGHSGGFTHPDTLRFTIGGLGGLGGGTNYAVVGVRQ